MFQHILTLLLSLTPLLTLTHATSAPGFPIQTTASFTVYFDYSDHYVDDDPGNRHLSPTDTLYSPELFKPSNETGDQTYLVLMVDPDAPLNDTKVQLLQWLQPNLRGTPRFLREDATTQNATNNAGAFYYPPSPPDDSGRHYYTLLLYRQPEGWDVPEKYASFSPPANLTSRAPFDVVDFVREGGLDEYLVASNYFYVDARNTSSSA